MPACVFRPLALACALAIATFSSGQAHAGTGDSARDYTERQVLLQSQPQRRASSDSQVLDSQVLQVEGADWLRINFTSIELPRGAKIRITSLEDGAQQTLNAKSLAQWQGTSAYFNGPAVRIEMLAAKGQRAGSYRIDRVMAGQPVPVTEAQCGPVDDRVASSLPDRARVDTIGCTANLMDTGCFITAGHCMYPNSKVKIVEFNVPKSNANGSIRHPAPKDQYTIGSVRAYKDGTALGDDWGLFKVNPNTETGLMPQQAQATPGLSMTLTTPAVGASAEIVGYGWDATPVDRYTQQIHTGPITMIKKAKNQIAYRIDTEGGNSGSAVLSGGRVVAIHTSGGCGSQGDGGLGNYGTLITHPGFQSAYTSRCVAPVASKPLASR